MLTSKARTRSCQPPRKTTSPMTGTTPPSRPSRGWPPVKERTAERHLQGEELGRLLLLGVSGPGEGDLPVGLDPAGPAGHDDDPVGEHDGLGDRVGHEHHRGLALLGQLQQEVAHLGAGDLVERGEGLVHEQHRRVEGERPDERHPLLHAAGQLVGVASGGSLRGRPAPAGRRSRPEAGRHAGARCRRAAGRWRGPSATAAGRGTGGRSHSWRAVCATRGA